MSLTNLSQEEILEISMIEMAKQILEQEKKAIEFTEIFDRIAELKQFKNSERDEKLAQFYTDLNINGSFLTIGSNLWGLKQWYPVEQIDEEITAAPKKKKKKKKATAKRKKEEIFEEDTDEDIDLTEEELDFDDEDISDDLDELDDFDEFDEEEVDEDDEFSDDEEDLDDEIDEEDEDEE